MLRDDRPTVPCKICGRPTPMLGTKLCDGCWEVEHRLQDFLRHPNEQALVRELMPKLDDWRDGTPDGWDYEAVLRENEVNVVWCDQMTGDGKTFEPCPPDLCGWSLTWKHGCIQIGQATEQIARKAAALFISLWLRGVSASFCNKLMDGYITFLERQEGTSMTFLAKAVVNRFSRFLGFRLTHEGMFHEEWLQYEATERRIAEALGPVADDEEIIVTFTRRKRHCPDLSMKKAPA